MHVKKKHPKKAEAPVASEEAELEPLSPEPSSTSDALLEQAIQSLGVPSDMMLSPSILPEESLELLEDEGFSTVNLNDLQ